MSLSDIKIALFSHLESIPGLPDIFYPNVGAGAPDDDSDPNYKYIRPDVLPANTAPIGIRATDQENGILQISIFVKKGAGEMAAADVAAIILANFPRNLNLNSVRIDKSGSVGPSIYSGKWQMTPISITYQHLI